MEDTKPGQEVVRKPTGPFLGSAIPGKLLFIYTRHTREAMKPIVGSSQQPTLFHDMRFYIGALIALHLYRASPQRTELFFILLDDGAEKEREPLGGMRIQDDSVRELYLDLLLWPLPRLVQSKVEYDLFPGARDSAGIGIRIHHTLIEKSKARRLPRRLPRRGTGRFRLRHTILHIHPDIALDGSNPRILAVDVPHGDGRRRLPQRRGTVTVTVFVARLPESSTASTVMV